jgi:hypothetical protein
MADETTQARFGAWNAAVYIAERLEQYQSWYDRKSVIMKDRFLYMKAISVVSAAIVPVLINIPWGFSNVAATVLSLFVVTSVALESVYHFGDQWKNYRSTEQFLSREKVLFLSGDGPYRGLDESTSFLLLVERCEGQIAAENSATLSIMAVAAQQSDSRAPTTTISERRNREGNHVGV